MQSPRTSTTGETNDDTRGNAAPSGGSGASPGSPMNEIWERMRDTRNVRSLPRSRSHPHRYKARPWTDRAHGSTERSVSSRDPGYSKHTTRRSRIACDNTVAAPRPVRPRRIVGAATSPEEAAAAFASMASAKNSLLSHARAASDISARSALVTSMPGAKESQAML